MDDKTIVDLFFRRDESAVSETEEKYGRYCFSIAYAILGSSSDSEECLNDAYLKLWESIPPMRPENLKTYLAKLVRNLSVNRYKKLTAEKRANGMSSVPLEELEGVLYSPDDEERKIDSMVLASLLNRFLSMLKAEHRVMFVKRYWYCRTVDEIAREMKIGKSKVKVTLMRTRNKLGEFLESEGYFYE